MSYYANSKDITLKYAEDTRVSHEVSSSFNYAGNSFHEFTWQGFNADPVPFSKELALLVHEEVRLAFASPNPLFYNVSREVIRLTGNETKRFIVALKAYYDSSNPVLPLPFLLEGIFDINFAAFLKKIRLRSFNLSYKMEAISDDELDNIPWFTISDLGDIFNYSYWFFWEEPDGEDWKHTLIPCPKISKTVEEEFKAVLTSILPETLEAVDPEEILLESSGSSCITRDMKSSVVWKEKDFGRDNKFSSEPLHGKLCFVRKRPTEIRECLVLPVSQSNSVKLIERQIATLCKDLPYSCYGMTEEDFEKEKKTFFSQHKFFLNRDLTKEGLTKPRQIIGMIFDVLEEKYPGIPAWKYRGIYDDLTFTLPDGSLIVTKRGHGLGMASALTTVMQITAFVWLKNHPRMEQLNATLDGLFYHDDGSIGSSEQSLIDIYAEEEEPFLQELQLMRKDKKTYMGPVGVICEHYSNKTLNRKESYWRYVRYLPFSACNIIHAKGLAELTTSILNKEYVPGLEKSLTSFFGWEWSPDEYKLPGVLGGWDNSSVYGVDVSMLDIEMSDLVNKGSWIGRPAAKPKPFKQKKPRSYLSYRETKYLIQPHDYDEINRLYSINQTYEDMQGLYMKGYDRERMENFYNYEFLKRRKEWFASYKPSNLFEVYQRVLEKNPWKDILPPREVFIEVPIAQVSEETVEPIKPMVLNSPLKSGLAYFYKKTFRNCIPWPVLPGMRYLVNWSRKGDNPFRISEKILHRSKTLPYEGLYKNPNLLFKERSWISDEAVYSAYCTVTTVGGFFPKPDFRSLGGEIMREGQGYIYKVISDPLFQAFLQVFPVEEAYYYYEGGLKLEDPLSLFELLDEEEALRKQQLELKDDEDDTQRDDIITDFEVWYGTGRPDPSGTLKIPLWTLYQDIYSSISYAEMVRSNNRLFSGRDHLAIPGHWYSEWMKKVGHLSYLEVEGGYLFVRATSMSDDMFATLNEDGDEDIPLWGVLE